MLNKIIVSPLNSVLFISDRAGAEPPEPIRGQMIWSNPTCVIFGCFPEQDGPTEIAIGSSNEVDPESLLVFDGEVETPSHILTISDVAIEPVLNIDVASTKTKIKILYSHPKWPDRITISVD
jgi:hypothetical protein